LPLPNRTERLAPAKVNLTLHVTGRRADGYHLLDSLVVFVGTGDRVTLAPAAEMSLRVTGPRAAGVPADRRNLVWQAAELLGPMQIVLEKHLPHAAGIGGGSADAAATLIAGAAALQCPLPPAAAVLALGADVPVCLSAGPVRMRGVGEEITPLPPLPPLHAVLVNPGRPLATPDVFRALERRDNPAVPAELPRWPDAAALCAWLGEQRNDLELPARALVPEIDAVLAALGAAPGCGLARMSGSGATCFGLFATEAAAEAARAGLVAAHPGWWVAAGPVLAGARAAKSG